MILKNESIEIEVSQDGAELRRVVDLRSGDSLLWHGDPTWWNRVSPVLFPFVGKVYDDVYLHGNTEYSMKTQHGFLRDQTFTLDEVSQHEVWYQFEQTDALKELYPFEYSVRIGYRLEANTVHVNWEVINHDVTTMYFSIGAHPAFLAHENDVVTFEKRDQTSRYVLEGPFVHDIKEEDATPLIIKSETFINDAVIYDNVDAVILHNKKDNRQIRVECKDFPFVGIWSPYRAGEISPFVCIEPWYGISDRLGFDGELKDKLGVQKLEANRVVQYSYSFTIL